MAHGLVQDKNPVTQVLRYAKPELQGFCPVLSNVMFNEGWTRRGDRHAKPVLP